MFCKECFHYEGSSGFFCVVPEHFGDIEDWLSLTHMVEYYLGKSRIEVMGMKKWELESALAFYIERKKDENKKNK